MKFIYLADTHIGGRDDAGYRRQARYLGHFQELINALGRYITAIGGVDCIIHGGDMVDECSADAMTLAADFFSQLPCPTYLVPGNHDLTKVDALERWRRYAPQFFPGGKSDFRLTIAGVQIDGLLCHWGETPAFWQPDTMPTPWLADEQLLRLSTTEKGCYAQVIVTHAPVYGVPSEQHGGSDEIHAPPAAFTAKLRQYIRKPLLVLGAHTHINMHLVRDDCHFVTVSAFSETPFDFKLIEITPDRLMMQTLSLAEQVDFPTLYDREAAYVQGRQCDRQIDCKIVI